MAISAYLHIDEKKFCIRDLDYQFDRDVGYSGLPNQRIRGGILQIVLEAPSRSDNIFSEWAISSDLMKNGEIWVYERDMQSLVRKIAFTDTLCVAYHERYRSSGKNPMLTSVIFAARLLNINGSEFRNDWPVLNDYEPASAHHPTTRTISAGTADKKPAEEKAPRPLVKSVAGPEEIKYKEKAIFEVCSYNTSNVTATDKSSVRWALKIDGKTEYLPDRGERLEYEVKDKKLEGKEITFMPYLSEPSESVCVKAKIRKIDLPLVIDRYRIKGKNLNGTQIADDLCYGFGRINDRYTRERIEDLLGFPFKYELNFNETVLWSNMRSMIKTFFSTGELEKVALKMVDKFEKGEGGEFSDGVLTKYVKDHESTQRFCKSIENLIAKRIRDSNGDINKIENKKVHFVDRKYGHPRFNTLDDTFSGGLTICMNDTWAYEAELIKYEEEIIGKYKTTYKITLFDHFGLDHPDLENIYIKQEQVLEHGLSCNILRATNPLSPE